MTEQKKMTRRAAMGGLAGFVFGVLRVDTNNDSPEEIAEKIAIPTVAGTGLGALASKPKIRPSKKFTEAEDQYRKGLVDETLRKRAEKRAERQRGDSENHR